MIRSLVTVALVTLFVFCIYPARAAKKSDRCWVPMDPPADTFDDRFYFKPVGKNAS